MYVLGVSGSPRKSGNTSILVREVLRHIRGEKRFVSLAGLDIHPCNSCDRCYVEKRECVIDDDIRWVIREMEKADVIILGSPCYFGMVSAQLKMLIDRTVSIYEKGSLKNKIGAAVVTQDVYGSGRGGELVRQALMEYLASKMGMIYAGGIIGEGGAQIGHIKKLASKIMQLYENISK
ncbi:flavodoxin family protein [Candidatus Bathyarchaeota archaeon]|nr:flavodoxin family protein [Candidatus Bathyarchaeota archaeon]